jgi:hypothetical protein
MSKIKQDTGTKTRKRKGWPVGVSDTVLQDLCRRMVHKEWRGKCAFVGTYYRDEPGQGYYCEGEVQWHHLKRRNIPHLKYCPTNGILLCELHHKLAKYKVWRERIEEKIGAEECKWLDMMEMKLFPDFLAEKGMTRNEWRLSQKAYLTELRDGAGERE